MTRLCLVFIYNAKRKGYNKGMLCTQCPRSCNIDRAVAKGFCREGEKIRVAKVIENFTWEEPCISGKKGALAIFFSGCNLRCEFCQNYEISHIGKGKQFTINEFRDFLLSFDLSKFDCIDLITPSHFSLQLLEALKGVSLPVPIVWNSNGYETEEMIKKLCSRVDVFLVDFKFYDSALSEKLCGARDYFSVASKAIKLMCEKKENIFKDRLMKQGVLIRHLILPDHVKDSMMILQHIKDNIKNPFVSIMSQFTPCKGSLQRKLTPLEIKTVLSFAERIGLSQGYYQDEASANDAFIPKF